MIVLSVFICCLRCNNHLTSWICRFCLLGMQFTSFPVVRNNQKSPLPTAPARHRASAANVFFLLPDQQSVQRLVLDLTQLGPDYYANIGWNKEPFLCTLNTESKGSKRLTLNSAGKRGNSSSRRQSRNKSIAVSDSTHFICWSMKASQRMLLLSRSCNAASVSPQYSGVNSSTAIPLLVVFLHFSLFVHVSHITTFSYKYSFY